MSWLLHNWQLKLLALALSVGLFAALAFSENPIQFATVDAKISYNNRPANLVLINPPPTTKVTVSGLAADIKTASIRADVDLSKIKKGGNVTAAATARVCGNGVTAQSAAPVTFSVDDLTTVQLDVEVRTPNVQQGWAIQKTQAICGNASQPCKISFSGPAGLEDGLKAYVTVESPVNANSVDQPTSTVQFDQTGKAVDPSKQVTLPQIGWNPQTVTAHVEAKQGTQSKQVALVDAVPASRPPNGYHITGVTIDPALITITGTPDVLANIRQIVLPAVDLSPYTSDHSFRLSIPAPDPTVQLSASVATVTYSIAPNPVVSPSPRPSP
jgi:YbbR domain-containing protein